MKYRFDLKNGKIKKDGVVIVVKDHIATIDAKNPAMVTLAEANGQPESSKGKGKR